MRTRRRLGAVIGSLAITILISGCEMLAPVLCTNLAKDGMNGQWDLSTIDGNPIPATGFQIPLRPEKLTYGTVDFYTQEWDGCDELKESSGMAVATYYLTKNGTPQAPKRYTGSFKYDASTKQLTLTGDGYEVPGSRVTTGLPVFILSPSYIGLGSYQLVFTKQAESQ